VGGPHGPYCQSERVNSPEGNLYKRYADELVDAGNAYRCFCSPELLLEKATQRAKLGSATEYDGTCSHISHEESQERAHNGELYVIRLVDSDAELGGKWQDLVFGTMDGGKERKIMTRDDIVLLKSDGWPTYHLANVVDDHFMEVSHVIRGAEWLKSTSKHQKLYRALGWTPPKFAHVGLLFDSAQKKLSKRDSVFDLDELKSKVLPEALMNFLVLLGWQHKGTDDVLAMNDMMNLVRRLY